MAGPELVGGGTKRDMPHAADSAHTAWATKAGRECGKYTCGKANDVGLAVRGASSTVGKDALILVCPYRILRNHGWCIASVLVDTALCAGK